MAKNEVVTKLTPADRKALAKHEETIRGGLTSFIEVGHALAEIRDSELYREEFKSFEAYCNDKWDLKRQTAYDKIHAAEIVAELQNVRSSVHVPQAESQALELAKAKTDAPKVWAEVLKRSPKLADGSPCTTAKKIAEIRDELLKPKVAAATPKVASTITVEPKDEPKTNGVDHEPPPELVDDEPPFEPPVARIPGEDDGDEELDAELGKIEDWDGAKINRLLKALSYYENKIVKAEAIIDLRIARMFPHHGLPLKRWSEELDSKARELKRFRQKIETAKRNQKAASA